MELNKTYITNKGRNLMAKVGAGTQTTFTKMVVSSQEYADSTASSTFEALTSLPNVKQEVKVSDVKVRDNTYVDIIAAVSNAELATSYKVGSFGFYAMDPHEGEILYAIAPVKQGTGDWFPANNGKNASSIEVKLVIQVGNSANVTLNVDSGAYASVTMLNEVKDEVNLLKDAVGLTDADVYGVEVDFPNRRYTRLGASKNFTPGAQFDNVGPFARRRCILTNDGTVLAYRGEDGYVETGRTAKEIVKGTSYPSGTPVQVMVEQPKYYYKIVPLVLDPIENGRGFHMRKFRAYISAKPKPGFKLHPAFIRDGVSKERIYLSAYNGSIFDTSANAYLLEDEQVADFANDMLCSIAGAKPASGLSQNLSRTNSRALAAKRGTGWQLRDIYAAYSTLLLFLIEYASFDTQGKIGQGVTSVTDDGVSNLSVKNGYTATLGNASGMAEGTNGKVSVTYRGEENIWGNIWNWTDGLNVYRDAQSSTHNFYVADHGFTDNIGTEPYKLFNATACQTEGYVSAFGYETNGENDACFFASETKGASNWGLCDYFYRNGGANNTWLAALLGGSWSYGASAGAGSLRVTDAASVRYRNVGARVLYVPEKTGE